VKLNREFTNRLYNGEADLNIVKRRKLWFGIAAGALLIAIISLFVPGLKPGIEFTGGNEFRVPVAAGSLSDVEAAMGKAVTAADSEAKVTTTQQLGDEFYAIKTSELSLEEAQAVRTQIAQQFSIPADTISDDQVSATWGDTVKNQALLSLIVFLIVVSIYLIIRFEWRMAAAAVASLLFDLVATVAVYALVGFEVTPSTVIGFLTILGFALYDVVVVFDKVQENTRNITGGSTQTYGEAANLALNQTLMRSINTSLVALLPVGGLLFIGAGLLGAGTLKDLGLVLFIGMGAAVYSSLFFATPFLVWLKEKDPKIKHHTQRVLARRSTLAARVASGEVPAQTGSTPTPSVAPKVGARPARPAGKRR
jgi:preprotein translocase subunit SecF